MLRSSLSKTAMAKSVFPSSFTDWRFLLLIIPPLSLLIFLSLSSSPAALFQSFLPAAANSTGAVPYPPQIPAPNRTESAAARRRRERKDAVVRSRVAVCLVGGARRFELTGPSIVEKVLEEYPNADLFLHSPLDSNAFKFSLLKSAPRIASVRIFEPKHVAETESEVRVLTAMNSPNGIQGLLQYFNLVEGCLTLIQNYQKQKKITYDWIVRTRVDGFWNDRLDPSNFVPGQYTVPLGSSYGGLNDRLGIGDLSTSIVALSRLSLVPKLDSDGFRQLNSETAFRAQLTSQNVSYEARRLPLCVVSDRKYAFPPGPMGVPVAALSRRGALSGAKCRPCKAACGGECAVGVVATLQRSWSWTDPGNGTIALCDASGEWEDGWEKIFDRVAGKKLAAERKRVQGLTVKKCVADFEEMKRRAAGSWEAPAAESMCKMGLETR